MTRARTVQVASFPSSRWVREFRAGCRGGLRLAAAAGLEGPLDVDDASDFLSTIELRVGREPGITRWRKRRFVATSRITTDAAEYFGLPRDRTVIMGSRITV